MIWDVDKRGVTNDRLLGIIQFPCEEKRFTTTETIWGCFHHFLFEWDLTWNMLFAHGRNKRQRIWSKTLSHENLFEFGFTQATIEEANSRISSLFRFLFCLNPTCRIHPSKVIWLASQRRVDLVGMPCDEQGNNWNNHPLFHLCYRLTWSIHPFRSDHILSELTASLLPWSHPFCFDRTSALTQNCNTVCAGLDNIQMVSSFRPTIDLPRSLLGVSRTCLCRWQRIRSLCVL